MSKEIDDSRKQGLMFPPFLDDLIPQNHPVRFINDLVDSWGVDFNQMGFQEIGSDSIVGRPRYSTKLLLKVWIYGYFNNIRSSRMLEKECYDSMSMAWLTNMECPDHNTLWRFWKENKQTFALVFKRSLKVALALELFGLVLQAIDGTRIAARVSNRSGLRREKLTSLSKDLEASIKEVMDQIENNEQNQDYEYLLPEELCKKQAMLDQIKTVLTNMDAINRDSINPKDYDSRMMTVSGAKKFAFNAQTVVDEKHHLITAAEVSQDESDFNLLVPMLEAAAENMGAKSELSLADNGYFSGVQLNDAEEKGYQVLINLDSHDGSLKAVQGYSKESFTYDEVKDVYICPQGKELKYRKMAPSRSEKYKNKVYQCQHYKDCPYRKQCSQSKYGRTIRVSPYEQAILNQREKLKDIKQRNLLNRRKQIVEPVFGIIKECMHFRRFTLHGLDNVKAQWSLVCLAYNLRKICRLGNYQQLNLFNILPK
jgi:transposase